MKILIACEYSGKVREAFRKLGHDAWSCDLLPSDELKQLEPPEQYEEYAKLMGSEYCRICGFNAVEFRKHIENRIAGLRDLNQRSSNGK